MKNTKKIVLASSVLFSVFAILFTFGINKADAATCVAIANGKWGDSSTWTSCGGIPDMSKDVIISDYLITVDSPAEAKSVTINNSGTTSGIVIYSSYGLTSESFITLNAPTSAGITTLNVNGSVQSTNLNIIGGASNLISEVIVNEGVLTVLEDINFSGHANQARLSINGNSGLVEVGGNFNNGGAFSDAGHGEVVFKGTGTQTQIIGSYNYNRISIINDTGGENVTLGGPVTANHLNIDSRHLDVGAEIFTINQEVNIETGGVLTETGSNTMTLGSLVVHSGGIFSPGLATLTVNGTTLIDSGGQITFNSPFLEEDTFTGNVTINGEWREVTPVDITFGGTLENNATVWNANTGIHTFSGSGFFIKGTTETSLKNAVILGGTTNLNDLRCDNLTVNASLINDGAITVINSLDGSNTLTNNGALYIRANPITIANIFAQSTNNVVIYDGTNQAIKIGDYENLYLMGSGIKTISSGINIGNSFEVSSGVVVNLTGTSSASFLKFNNITQKVGTWGATGSGALFPNDTYLTGSGKINVTNTTVLPTLAIAISDNALTTGETSTVIFTFSEVPASFSNANITVTNLSGSLSNVVVDPLNPLVYTAVFSPNSNKNVSANVISVDTLWTDTSTSLNHPTSISISPSYSVYTISSSSGSGGGGGYVSKKVLVPVVVAPVVSPVNLSQIVLTFTQPLKRGMTHNEVIKLQKFLNKTGYIITPNGAGSPGNEINIFGSRTTKALMKFQKDNEMKADGIVGKMTRALLNEMWDDSYMTGTVASAPKVIDTTLVKGSFTKPLKQGAVDNEVIALQKFLNKNGYVITDAGAGSPGNEINIFGSRTTKALMKFQKDNNLKEDGVVGPQIRSLLNSKIE